MYLPLVIGNYFLQSFRQTLYFLVLYKVNNTIKKCKNEKTV